MAGEPRLSQLQPAVELLQAGKQGDTEGGGDGGSGLRRLGNFWLDDLLSILPFLARARFREH